MDRVTQEMREHYSRAFAQYGPTTRGVDWGPKVENAELRYRKMLAVLDVERPSSDPPSLLDVGCGYGGLWSYATANGVRLDYVGIDVAGNMIEWARRNLAGAVFECANVHEYSPSREFDYVVCNGILTQKLSASILEMDRFAQTLIKTLLDLCRCGAAFNVMTTKVNFTAGNLYYRNPVELLAYCLAEISTAVRIDHSYGLYEYTVYLYREADGACRP